LLSCFSFTNGKSTTWGIDWLGIVALFCSGFLKQIQDNVEEMRGNTPIEFGFL
jgi:hypothetical protein